MMKVLVVITTLVGSGLDVSINEVANLDQCRDEAPIVLRTLSQVEAVREAKVECIERTRQSEDKKWQDEVKVALTTDGWEEATSQLSAADRRDPGYHRFEPEYQRRAGGYDRYGYDRFGYDRYGYDRFGFDRYGYDHEGYDRYGYDRYGYDRRGYDRYGNHRSWAQPPQQPYGPRSYGWQGSRLSHYYRTLCREFPDRPECQRVQPGSPQSVPVPNPGYAVPNPGYPVPNPARPVQ